LRALSAVAPGAAARIAARFWFAIPTPKISQEAARVIATGTRFDMTVDGIRVAGWRWGEATQPAMLLCHGWGGYAGQFHAMVEPLTRAGYQVIAFDAPSHGASEPGKLGPNHATLFDFADTLLVLARETREIAAIIAHSGGCAAVAWALTKEPVLAPRRIVFIAPFGSPKRYMAMFQTALGLTDAVMDRFRADTERQFNFRWADFEVTAMADRLKAGRRVPPLLVVHDRNDKETSWEDGNEIARAWPGATLRTTTGLGHNRILRDPSTIDAVVDFIG